MYLTVGMPWQSYMRSNDDEFHLLIRGDVLHSEGVQTCSYAQKNERHRSTVHVVYIIDNVIGIWAIKILQLDSSPWGA